MKKTFIKILAVVAVLACVPVALLACAPTSVEKAKEKMAEENYAVTSFDVSSEDSENGMEAVFTAVKIETILPLKGDYIFVFYFDSAEHAHNYAKQAKENASDYLPGVLTKAFIENGEVGISGKCVYYGSEDAVEDFKD